MSQISAQYCDGLEVRIKELQAENAALKAELAIAQKDAERYRHIRLLGYPSLYDFWNHQPIFVQQEDGSYIEASLEAYAVGIDAAIDKAMEAK